MDDTTNAIWPLTISVLLLAAAAGGGLLLHRMLFGFLGRLSGGAFADVVGRLRGPLRVALPLLAVNLAWPVAALPDGLAMSLQHLIRLGFILAAGWLAAAAVGLGTDRIARRYDMQRADNLAARSVHTQLQLVRRMLVGLIGALTVGAMLMTIPGIRAVGVSLLASAGVAGVVAGLAARPTVGNLIAGLQVAMTQPIRIDDVVIVEGEWGRIEEIRSTFVVVRVWDERRLVVPLTHFIEKPFQNWTRRTADLIGTVFLRADYRLPVDEVRSELSRIVAASPHWDGKVCILQVTEAGERSIELRALVSAASSSAAWDLRCEVRERLVAFVRDRHPDCLPVARLRTVDGGVERSA